jgi:glycosyltransferase involved in cell wall biosynthesis
MSRYPRISIVTPSFNQGRYLEETIRSVLDQGYPNLEYVVIDGESTDDSLAIIRRYADRLTYWASEPDRGQSHAINKGLARCSGEIFNWINSDDALCTGALHAVAAAWREKPGCVIAGVEEDIDEDGRENLTVSQKLTPRHFIHWREAVRSSMSWGQPVTFLPMSAVRRAGGVREDLRYSMDHLLMIEVLKYAEVVYIPEHLARFRIHHDSKTATAGHPRFRLERIRAIRKLPALAVDVTRRELDEDLARTLVACARLESRQGRRWKAWAHLAEAAWLSRRETWSAIQDFRWPGWLSRGRAAPVRA